MEYFDAAGPELSSGGLATPFKDQLPVPARTGWKETTEQVVLRP